MGGFVTLVSELLVESGLPDATVFCKNRIELPGFFRPTKEWDLLIVADGQLIASMEFKSHIGSFGNNYNNRVEEAIGNATDLWTAYRQGAFRPSGQPWLGYLILLEESPRSMRPIKRVPEPHFKIFEEFRGATYARRYELFCLRLVRERLYDATCLLLSDQVGGLKGRYKEPNPEIGFANFVASLAARATAFVKTGRT
jgi:hypothetical protein